MSNFASIDTEALCYHCGEECNGEKVVKDEKHFCCEGCKLVFEILQDNNLCTYYDLEKNPGISLKSKNYGRKYSYLENEKIVQKLLDFSSDNLSKITLYIPSIHCSSCIWLLENLYKIKNGISVSRVNFIKKEISISFDPRIISLRQIVELLSTLGYEPTISLENYSGGTQKEKKSNIFLKLGVTGFCTGNIMVFSFPEYFGLGISSEAEFKSYFTALNILLSLPVFFYGGSGYLISAFQSLKKKVINIDVPISIGITTLFGRSLFETLMGISPGYWDSLSGLIFFLLVGKWLQQKTFENLSFDRNYKSYFPLSATVISGENEEIVPVTDINTGDRILVRNQELIPADSILLSKNAWIDYSFVTGESDPVEKKEGDYIYAGGRQVGNNILLSVQKAVSQSYLTQLWNNEAFAKEKTTAVTKLAENFSRYFTWITLSVAVLAALFWYVKDPSIMWDAFTAVLIIACPCALSLSMPFTMENTMRIFGKNGYYVKNPDVIQHLAETNHIVFDKTGTLTNEKNTEVIYRGTPLSQQEFQSIKSIVANSTHPLSRKLFNHLKGIKTTGGISDFKEIPGFGLEGKFLNFILKIGSREFTRAPKDEYTGTMVHVSFNNHYKGYFEFHNPYRKGLKGVFKNLKNKFQLTLLSGDHQVDENVLVKLFGHPEKLHFEQKPLEKLEFINTLKKKGDNVLMIGDGLNDAGALKMSNVGMVLTDDVHAFFPSCDILADAEKFSKLPDIIAFSRSSVNIVKISFLLSMIYNFIGVGWAISGNLSPVFAAILMPVSSISVVGFAVGASSFYATIKKL